MTEKMQQSGCFKSVAHKEVCDKIFNSLNKNLIIEFPEQRHLYFMLGYSKITKKVIGSTYKGKKDAKDIANNSEYLKNVSFALN